MGRDEFTRSSYCHSGACVEVAQYSDLISIRDSKDPDGTALHFTPEEWKAFVAGVKAGEFDL